MATEVCFPVYEHPAISVEPEAMTSNETTQVQQVPYLTRPVRATAAPLPTGRRRETMWQWNCWLYRSTTRTS